LKEKTMLNVLALQMIETVETNEVWGEPPTTKTASTVSVGCGGNNGVDDGADA
jgi:hypothetical protein